MKTILKYWLLIAIVVTGLCGLLYGVVQQNIRQGANELQVQLAEDTAAKLASGQQVQNVVPTEKVDITKSIAPYLIVFDVTGKPIASSAQLNGQIPTLPPGIFNEAQQKGEDRFTWQPQPSVRSAVVVTPFKGSARGFVLAGRSLREVELLEDHIGQIVLAGWLSLLFITFLATIILSRGNISKSTKSSTETMQ